jgi:hypothetical protein
MNKNDEYPIEDIIEYTIALVNEFGKAHGLEDEDAWSVLRRNGCVKLIEDTYGFLHTQSFPYVIQVINDYIQRNGGSISESEYRYVKEGLIKDMALILIKERHLPMEESLNLLYGSDLYKKLSDAQTGLISQSPRYLLQYL